MLWWRLPAADLAELSELPALAQLADLADLANLSDLTELAGLANLTASVMTEGTTSRSAAEIDAAAEALGSSLSSSADWDGSGRYLVPLATAKPDVEGRYHVAAVPVSPGFAPGGLEPVVRIYRDSPEVRAQYKSIRKPDGE